MENTAKKIQLGEITPEGFGFDNEVISDESLSSLDEEIMADFQKRLLEDDTSFYDFDEEDDDEDYEVLTLETAVADFKNGNQDAFDYIFLFYRPKFENIARKMNDEDLSQELSITLYRAALNYNPNAGAKFNTFFWKCARNEIGCKKKRQTAQKRGGSKHAQNKELLALKDKEKNGESLTAEEQKRLLKLEEKAKPTKTISLQSSYETKDNSVEMESFIEDKTFKNQFKDADLKVDLDSLKPILKEKEIKAIDMIIKGYKLEEIGRELGNITAPAVHVMLRRLGKKKNLKNKLKEIFSNN